MRDYIIWLLLLLISVPSWASNSSMNLAIPMPNSNYQSDRIRSGEIDCSNAIGGGTNLEFGVTGILTVNQDPITNSAATSTSVPTYSTQPRDVGVYARITIPLDGPKQRINCNALYELELKRKKMEIEKLQQELNKLRKLQFEN